MFARRRTYLDYAAAHPVTREAQASFMRAADMCGNPASPHAEGRAGKEVLESARKTIATFAGVKTDAVLFTSGATEANALALEGLVRARIEQGADPASLHALYLPSAHASTIGTMARVAALGVVTEALKLTDRKIDLTALRKQLRPQTLLVALEAVCGETGTRFDTRGVRNVLNAYSKAQGGRIYLHADASQLPLAGPFELTRLACDTLSLDAQKAGGVRGIGVLIAPRHVPLAALIHGGGQERDLRPGTPATALACAFAAALAEASKARPAFLRRATGMRARLVSRLTDAIPDIVENKGSEHVSHILNLSFPGRDTEYLAALLDEAGFAVSTRSACATDEAFSRAVLALTHNSARAASTLRVSWGGRTTERDLVRFEDALIKAVRFLDRNAL